MAKVGRPMSTVRTPSWLAVIGPMVEPQPMSLRVTKLCTGTSFSRHRWRKKPAVSLLVA